MTLPCIVCGKVLKSALPASVPASNQPNDGTVFSSHGNYGSTVWDPMSASRTLEINVCDPCLVERADRVLHVKDTTSRTSHAEPWTPGEQQ